MNRKNVKGTTRCLFLDITPHSLGVFVPAEIRLEPASPKDNSEASLVSTFGLEIRTKFVQ
jgi:hypothetical protein